MGYLEISIRHEPFFFLPQRALFRPLQKQLVLSDVHLGKASHFRRKGIAMPSQSHLRDIDKLHFLIDLWLPETVLILGDLFHSEYNNEWLWFKSLVRHYPDVQFILLEGNHDILPRGTYVIPNLLKIGLLEEQRFIFSHHPLDNPEKLNVCGHVHPGIRVQGMARESFTFPCFSLSEQQLTLPAFGELTGMHLVKPDIRSKYFVVTGQDVKEV